jgi:hypothetical protein
MTDERPGDAELKRWLTEQDPFGNAQLEQQVQHAKVEKQLTPGLWLVSSGIALPYVAMMLAVLALPTS